MKQAEATAVITPLQEKAVFTTNEGEKIEATFYSHCVWLDGIAPPEEEHLPKAKEQGGKDQQNSDKNAKVKEEDKEPSPVPMEALSMASALSVLKQVGNLCSFFNEF